ncbi:MAG: hypothetical protein VYE73_10815 [Acidobacteriota bacterium]|nr:hypothetical protein [Acidobacteriota bacterium]
MKPKTLALVALAATLVATGAFAQAGGGWTPPRTASGQPDLQGIWVNNTATPFERPKIFGEKATLNDEELADLKARLEAMREDLQAGDLLGDFLIQKVLEDPEFRGFDQKTGNYNSFWLADRELDNRTSLVIDPPDGRLPPMTPEGQKRLAGSFGRFGRLPEDHNDLGLNDRCISYGVPNLLAGYNSYFHLVQSDSHVGILQELIHDARLIPLDGRPHVADQIRQLHGDSRGRWEGDALVVETRNYRVLGAPRGSSQSVTVTERFERTGRDVLEWTITFDDPDTWTQPWTLMIPLARSTDAIFEYACHEGNYALRGILGGARAQEVAQASSN